MVKIKIVVIIRKILANLIIHRKFSNLELTSLLALIIVFTGRTMIETRLSKRQVQRTRRLK